MTKTTYLQDNLKDGKLIRWPSQCFPLKFYISPFRWYNSLESDKYFYQKMVIAALEAWEKVSNNKIQFQIVSNLNDSQINLEWRRVDRKSLGHCYFNYDKTARLYSAEVEIGISDGIIHKQYMDENEVFHTILHEIGHSLGLGHSQNTQDIMYTPHQYGMVNLSQGDIDSINWLYSFPAGTNVKDIASAYSINSNDIDEIISKLTTDKPKSQFETVMSEIQNPTRNLEEEQEKIAQFKKYNLMIQNIKLPQYIHDKFKKPQS